jgi:hypothetical protein
MKVSPTKKAPNTTLQGALDNPPAQPLAPAEMQMIRGIIADSTRQVNTLLALIVAQRGLKGNWGLSADCSALVQQTKE